MKLGSLNINSIKLGTTPVSEVRMGNVLIWPNTVIDPVGNEIITTSLYSDPSIRVYHRFENGALLADSSGNNRTALLNSNAVFDSNGKFGRSLNMQATTAYLQLATDVIPQGSFTVMYWEWLFEETHTQGRPSFTLGSAVGNWGISCRQDYNATTGDKTSGFFTVIGGVGKNANKIYTTADGFSNLTKKHRAYTYDGAEIKQYVNGDLIAAAAASGLIRGVNTEAYIGRDRWNGIFHKGSVADFAVFGKACTQSEIQTVAL